ncbi:MAG TPA: polysaccharide deacetylase family protein [Clostridiales bacterium]|nr:polysaccharide deacetylase family protein [Clostridiales bacterium]
MKRIFNRQRILVAAKMMIILMFLSATLPFYGGTTTSALKVLASAYNQGKEKSWESETEGQAPLPANMDYVDDSPSETVAPVQVIPLPTSGSASGGQTGPQDNQQPGSTSSPAPIPGGCPSPETSPQPGLPDPEGTGSKPTDKPSATDEPISSGTPNPGSQPNTEEGDAIPVDSGVLLQDLLNKVYRHEGEKVAYLTFDDGPTPSITSAILDILAEENIKATFFVIGNLAERYPEIVKRQYEEGHGIGNHTYTHVFKHIYKKPENFVDELIKTENVLQSILGEDKNLKLIRFPGGSFGNNLKPFREAANEAGYAYVDWNSLNGDAESVKPLSAEKLIARMKETVHGQSGLVVLMHDAPQKQTTVEALPKIIKFLKSKGYRFELLPGSR